MKLIQRVFISITLLLLVSSAISLFAQEAEVSVKVGDIEVEQGGITKVYVTFKFPEGMHQTLQEDFFYIDVLEDSGVTLDNVVYPEGIIDEVGLTNYFDEATIEGILFIDPALSIGEHSVTITAGYQLCYDSGACTMPQEVDLEVELSIIEGEGVVDAAQEADVSIYFYLLLALIGGLILNFTPCVFPVLSLRAFTLIRDSQSDRKKIALNSFVYSIGVVVSFLIMAVIIVLLKASGEMIGWGFQFQNPIFVFSLTSVMFVFALSLFDVFIITAPESQTASKMSSKGGLLGAFFMGIFAVLLGTPCTAPMLGAALAFAFAQPPVMIFTMFFLIGVGMSLPFLLIAVKPQVVNKFPRPGDWMNTLKVLMGFILLFWAVKQLNVLYYQIGGAGLISVLYFLLALSFAAWIFGKYVRPDQPVLKRIVAIIAALIIIGVVGYKTLDFDSANSGNSEQTNSLEGRWQVFDLARVEELRENNVPVFIDFTAKWCTTCQTNEMTVLKTAEIQDAFESKGVEIFVGDFTNKDDQIAQEIRKYGRVGVPVYVFFLPGEKEPLLLPEMINKKMVHDVLEKIK